MKRKLTLQAVAAMGAVVASIAIAGCTKPITADQMSQIQDKKREIASLENSIQQNNAEKARLNAELQTDLAQVQKCGDDKQFVMDKLSRWPDCWPDWHPVPPPDTTKQAEQTPHKHRRGE